MDNSLNPFDILGQELTTIQKEIKYLQEKVSAAPPFEEDDLLNLEGVAKLLHRSVDTIYAYTHKKQIPHCKVLGSLIFSKKEIVEWVKSFKVKTLDEIEIDADNHFSRKNKSKNLSKLPA